MNAVLSNQVKAQQSKPNLLAQMLTDLLRSVHVLTTWKNLKKMNHWSQTKTNPMKSVKTILTTEDHPMAYHPTTSTSTLIWKIKMKKSNSILMDKSSKLTIWNSNLISCTELIIVKEVMNLVIKILCLRIVI